MARRSRVLLLGVLVLVLGPTLTPVLTPVLTPAPALARASGSPAPRQVDAAVRALRSGALYVAPGTAAVDVSVLRRALAGSTDVAVAVLPATALVEAGTDVNGLPGVVAAGLQRRGTVVVLVGGRVALSSIGSDPATLGRALDAAQAALARGPASPAHRTAVLVQLVRTARAAPAAFPLPAEQSPPRRAGSPSGWSGYLALALIIVGLGVGIPWSMRRGRRRRPPVLPRRRVHVDATGRLMSVEDAGEGGG